MSLRNRRLIVAGAAAALLLMATAAPRHADFQILAAEKGDADPQRVHAAIDMGWMAVSVLITWTRKFAH